MEQKIDESSLTERERLGLAYCRLNRGQWDDFVGEKPDGFDSLPEYEKPPVLPFMCRKKSKYDYIMPAMRAIKSILGEAETSWYWWKFALNRTREEWLKWYLTQS